MVALSATFTLLLYSMTASASRSLETGGVRSAAAAGRLTFTLEGFLGFMSITCDVTLLRTIGGRIDKTTGTLFGKVTGVAIDRGEPRAGHCQLRNMAQLEIRPLADRERPGVHRELGSGVLLYDVTGGRAELWKLIYDSFQGTLPEIAGINFHIKESQFLIEFRELAAEPNRCLFLGGIFGLIRITAGTASTAEIVLERTRLEVTILPGSPTCRRGVMSGQFAITPNVRVRLL